MLRYVCYSDVLFRDSTDVFRKVIGSYEDRQKSLLSENGDLRIALRDLQKQLIAMLRSDNPSRSAGEESAEVCRCDT